MDFNVYAKISELFLKEEGEEFLFARCFLTLEWNLPNQLHQPDQSQTHQSEAL
jgi:hypothetical protein